MTAATAEDLSGWGAPPSAAQGASSAPIPDAGTSAATPLTPGPTPTPATPSKSPDLQGWGSGPTSSATGVSDGRAPSTAINDPSSVLSLSDQYKMGFGTGTGQAVGNVDYLQNKFGADNVKIDKRSGDPVVNKDGVWFHTKEQSAWQLAKDFVKQSTSDDYDGALSTPAAKRIAGVAAGQASNVAVMGINAMAAAGLGGIVGLSGGSALPVLAATAAGGASIANAGQAYMNNMGRIYGTYKADPKQEMQDLAGTFMGNLTNTAVKIGTMPNATSMGKTLDGVGDLMKDASDSVKTGMKYYLSRVGQLGTDAANTIVDQAEKVAPFIKSLASREPGKIDGAIVERALPEVQKAGIAATEIMKQAWSQGTDDVLTAIGSKAEQLAASPYNPTATPGLFKQAEVELHPASMVANVWSTLQASGAIVVKDAKGNVLKGTDDILKTGLNKVFVTPGSAEAMLANNLELGDAKGALAYSQKIVSNLDNYKNIALALEKAPLEDKALKMMQMRQGLKSALTDLRGQAYKEGEGSIAKNVVGPTMDVIDTHLKQGIDAASDGAYSKMLAQYGKTATTMEPARAMWQEVAATPGSYDKQQVMQKFYNTVRTRSDSNDGVLQNAVANAEKVGSWVDPKLAKDLSGAYNNLDIAHAAQASSPMWNKAGVTVGKFGMGGVAMGAVSHNPMIMAGSALAGAVAPVATSPRMATDAALTAARGMNAIIGQYGDGSKSVARTLIQQNPEGFVTLLASPVQAVQAHQQTQAQLAQIAQAHQQQVKQTADADFQEMARKAQLMKGAQGGKQGR